MHSRRGIRTHGTHAARSLAGRRAPKRLPRPDDTFADIAPCGPDGHAWTVPTPDDLCPATIKTLEQGAFLDFRANSQDERAAPRLLSPFDVVSIEALDRRRCPAKLCAAHVALEGMLGDLLTEGYHTQSVALFPGSAVMTLRTERIGKDTKVLKGSCRFNLDPKCTDSNTWLQGIAHRRQVRLRPDPRVRGCCRCPRFRGADGLHARRRSTRGRQGRAASRSLRHGRCQGLRASVRSQDLPQRDGPRTQRMNWAIGRQRGPLTIGAASCSIAADKLQEVRIWQRQRKIPLSSSARPAPPSAGSRAPSRR